MNRVTFTFLGLLSLATFASGQLWIRGRMVAAGGGTFWDTEIAGLSALALLFTLTALSYLLSRAAPTVAAVRATESDERQEETDAKR